MQFHSAAFSRRAFLGGMAATASASLVPGRIWAQASSAVEIPQTTVRLGGFAVPNHGWTVLAARKGFLKDVGITMAGNAPKMMHISQLVPQIERKELDISTMYYGLMTQTLDKVTNVRPIFVYSYFQGNTILTAPDSGFKTVDEFMKGGMDWSNAAAAAMKQLKGQKFAVYDNSSTYPWINFALSLGGLSMSDANTIPIEDPKAVQLAINGQISFAAPGGAAQIYQLRDQAGWKPVISLGQMLKYIQVSPESPVNTFLNYDLIQCSTEYLNANHDTVLRFCSAIYRTLDYIFGPEQQKALTEYAPFINANAGAQLNAASLKFIFDEMDPFFQWKDQSTVWDDTKSPVNYRNIYEPTIARLIKAGTIKDQAYDLDQLFPAKSIWKEMVALKDETSSLLAKADSSMSADRKKLFDLAQQHYGYFNFLDANRFAKAALT